MRETLLLVIGAAAVFSPSLAAGFHLDDFALFQDPRIVSPGGFGLAATRPLTWFTFWANYQLGGENPFGYHLVNLLLHLASIVLVRDLLSRLVPDRKVVLLATAIFALHPLQTEAIVYVFARSTLLMTVFCLLSLREWTLGRRWVAVAWFVPALLAKEECVAFPLFLVLLDRKITRQAVAMLALSVAVGVNVLMAASSTPGSGAGAQSGIRALDYLLTQGIALCRYARLFVLPYGLTPDPPLEVTTGWQAYAAWVLIALAVVAASRRTTGRWLLAALILIAPSSSVFPAEELAADRRAYLPMFAIATAAAILAARAPRWLQAALVAALAIVSARQCLLWQNGEALWREAVRIAPGKVRPRLQLARMLPPQEGLKVLVAGTENADVASMRGGLYMALGQPGQALTEFGRALALAPNDAKAMNNRGVALLELGQREAALADFRRALAIDPCLFDARANLRRLGVGYPASPECRYTPAQERALAGGG